MPIPNSQCRRWVSPLPTYLGFAGRIRPSASPLQVHPLRNVLSFGFAYVTNRTGRRRHPGSPVEIFVQTLRDGAKQLGPCNSSTARRFNRGVIRGASVIRPGSNVQDKMLLQDKCCEEMAWQAEANATLGSPPLLPLPRRISDEHAEFVVILIVISLECFCGTAPQGGADLLPLGCSCRPRLR